MIDLEKILPLKTPANIQKFFLLLSPGYPKKIIDLENILPVKPSAKFSLIPTPE
ncbi:MAG: hypothetical protein WBA93_26480 [Microcoleaceae cyanobacterium]